MFTALEGHPDSTDGVAKKTGISTRGAQALLAFALVLGTWTVFAQQTPGRWVTDKYAKLPQPSEEYTNVVLNNVLYLIGGNAAVLTPGAKATHPARVMAYDLAGDKWTEKKQVPFFADHMTAAMIIDDRRHPRARVGRFRPIKAQTDRAGRARDHALLEAGDRQWLGLAGTGGRLHLLPRFRRGHRLDRPQIGLSHYLQDLLDLRMQAGHGITRQLLVAKPAYEIRETGARNCRSRKVVCRNEVFGCNPKEI